jgi:peptidoglycan/LPS O-acetylase OafA/YrhL
MKESVEKVYWPELDGLRALAVLMVITVHMHSRSWQWLAGSRGVTIFFVLSGFLITSLALKEEGAEGRLSLAAFYSRRCFRILPLYYLVLGVYVLLICGLDVGGPAHKLPFTRALPYYLFYLQEFSVLTDSHGTPPFYHSWSLGIEEKFYLVWPLLCFALLWQRKHVRLWTALGLIVPLTMMGRFFQPYACILFGCALALIGVRKWMKSTAVLALGLGALSIFQIGISAKHPSNWETTGYAAIFTVVLASLRNTAGIVKTALSWRPLTHVGRVSYGVYLVHLLCLNAAEKVTSNPLASYIGAALVSIAVASLLYYGFEKPMINIGRRLGDRVAGQFSAGSEAVVIGLE